MLVVGRARQRGLQDWVGGSGKPPEGVRPERWQRVSPGAAWSLKSRETEVGTGLVCWGRSREVTGTKQSERGRRTCRSAGGAQGPLRSIMAALQGGGSPWQVVPEQSPVGGSLAAVCGETA